MSNTGKSVIYIPTEEEQFKMAGLGAPELAAIVINDDGKEAMLNIFFIDGTGSIYPKKGVTQGNPAEPGQYQLIV